MYINFPVFDTFIYLSIVYFQYTIENHYLKHHPMYEFRNFRELDVDPYRYWLHGRADYFNSETY